MIDKVTIQFNDKKYLNEIVMLSKAFEDEGCCNGVVRDNLEFLSTKNIAVAIYREKVIGYGYGIIEIKDKSTSYYNKNDKIFYLEEIYISKEYRNKKVGSKLINFLVEYAKSNGCKYFETCAVSKKYKKLLKFYIKKVDMQLYSARLIKKL